MVNCARRSLRIVAAAFLPFTPILSRSVKAQTICEHAIEARLQNVLRPPAGDTILITRDYSPAFFGGYTFFRASVQTGFHTKPRRAAVVVVRGVDTMVVAELEDLSGLWARVTAGPNIRRSDLPDVLLELLWQVGFIERGDRRLRSAGDVSRPLLAALGPNADLSQVSPESVMVSPDGIQSVSVFLENADGVVRLQAMTDHKGSGRVEARIIASRKKTF
jgi:hypothetical protein